MVALDGAEPGPGSPVAGGSVLLSPKEQALFADEIGAIDVLEQREVVAERELAALITALHRARQNDRPISLVAAGLPQLAGQLGKAKSYAERLFLFTAIGPLDNLAASDAIVHPIEAEAR